MISISEIKAASSAWIKTRCSDFSQFSDIPEDAIIPFYSSNYGNLVAFTSLELKEQRQHKLIDYLTSVFDPCVKFTDSCIGTEWKGLIRKNGKPELVFAECDAEWFLLQCKYPEIMRVY